MDDNKDGTDKGGVPKNGNLISAEQFLERLKKKQDASKAPQSTADVLKGVSADLVLMTAYVSGLSALQSTLLDIMSMQHRFITEHVGPLGIRQYLEEFKPLSDICVRKVAKLESLK